MFNILNYLNQSMQSFPPLMKVILWVFLAFLVFFMMYLVGTILFFPFMYLYNRLTDKNKSNALEKEDYLFGELTTKLHGNSIAEVIEISSGTALSTYPAKFYREEDRQSDLLLLPGTKVLIIDFDSKGIALVVKSNQF